MQSETWFAWTKPLVECCKCCCQFKATLLLELVLLLLFLLRLPSILLGLPLPALLGRLYLFASLTPFGLEVGEGIAFVGIVVADNLVRIAEAGMVAYWAMMSVTRGWHGETRQWGVGAW